MATKYKANTGLDYRNGDGEDVRVEAGDEAVGLPARSVKWLLEQGHIEVIEPTQRGGDDGHARP